MIKICFINTNPDEVCGPFYDLLHNKIFPKVVRPDTKVVIKGVSPGLRRPTDMIPEYFRTLNAVQIAEQAFEAYKEGFDAVVIGCSEDPFLYPIREMIDIPVIGEGEACLHLACMLGYKFGIVALNEPKIEPRIFNAVRINGLEDRMIADPIAFMSMPTFEIFTKGFEDPEPVTAEIVDRAKACVDKGAEVVIIWSTGLGTFATRAGVSKIEGVDVPILAPIDIALKMAELRVDLKRSLGIPSMSRARMYATPSDKDIKRVRKLFGLKELW